MSRENDPVCLIYSIWHKDQSSPTVLGGTKVHLPQEMAFQFLKVLRLGVDGPVSLHLGIYSRKRKHVHIQSRTEVCSNITYPNQEVTTAQCPSKDKWVIGVGYSHTVPFSAIGKNELPEHPTI